MKHFASLLAAAVLIAAVYIYQFGVPFLPAAQSLVSGLMPSGSSQQAGRPDGAGAGGERARGVGESTGESTGEGAGESTRGAGRKPEGAGQGGGSGARAAGPGGRRRPQTATYVTTAAVVFQPYSDNYSAIGTGVAQKSVSLVSEVSGQIRDVLIDGTPVVAKDDVLIQLDDTSERINVEIAEANLSKAQDSLERYQALQKVNSGVIPEVTIKEAEAAVAVARGNLALAEETLKERSIRSPIDGKLGLIDLEVGDYLSSGTRIVDINNTETILVSFELPERAISILALEMPVRAVVPSKPGQYFQGKITAFDSVIDEATRTVTVKAAIDNRDGLLWPGMTFTVLLAEVSRPLASVPAMAMTWTREGTQVWLEDKGTVRPVPVLFRKRIDDTIWVEADLDPGVRVVVDGVHKLRPGAKVFVTGETPEDDPVTQEPGPDTRPDSTAGSAENAALRDPSVPDQVAKRRAERKGQGAAHAGEVTR